MNQIEEEFTPEEAIAAGYTHKITTAYTKPKAWMRHAVMADMKRGNISAVYVRVREGLEVWRKPSNTNTKKQ